MAQRERAKSKQAATRAPASLASPGSTMPLELRVKTLEIELERARARIRELEASRVEAVNRIDWVIDSLHNVVEKHG